MKIKIPAYFSLNKEDIAILKEIEQHSSPLLMPDIPIKLLNLNLVKGVTLAHSLITVGWNLTQQGKYALKAIRFAEQSGLKGGVDLTQTAFKPLKIK